MMDLIGPSGCATRSSRKRCGWWSSRRSGEQATFWGLPKPACDLWGRDSAASAIFLSAIVAACAGPAGDGRDHQHFVAVFEGILLIAQEADVFFVDVEVDEAAHLALFVAQVGLQRRKGRFDLGDQLGQIAGVRLDLAGTIGVLLKCIRQQDSNGHWTPPDTSSRSSFCSSR